MTVESLIFITLGLVAVGLILKMAAAKTSSRKPDTKTLRYLQATLKLSEPLPEDFEENLAQMVDSGKYINAMKYIRENTKLDLKSSKKLVDLLKSGKKLSSVIGISSADSALEQLTNAAGKSSSPSYDPALLRDAAPTAEMQVIGEGHAMQMAQILVSKGQVIEAVKILRENAGYDMEKAVATVDSMGKKVYTAD